jgi:hypothetical protein
MTRRRYSPLFSWLSVYFIGEPLLNDDEKRGRFFLFYFLAREM